MPVEWALNIFFSIFNGKGYNRNCSCHRAVKLLEHGMKVVERMLEKRLEEQCLVMKCNLALCLRGTIDAVFILRRLQEEHHTK